MLRPLLTSALVALVVLARLLAGLPNATDHRVDESQHLDERDRNATVQSLPVLGTSDARPRWVPNLTALVPKTLATVVERRAIAVLAVPAAAPHLLRAAGIAGARAPPVAA